MEYILDKVSQGYKGEMGDEVSASVKKRIHWMLDNVSGNTIIDVGCSQGIVSILLAKAGNNVVGIDLAKESIDYAKMDKEKEKLGNNLNFICDDFLTYKFNQKFDCIIMGEILEHTFSPTLFLDKAKELLNENGRLIITVPFGINPFPDHMRTYYFTELFYQINERVNVSDIEFFGGWIGYIADMSLCRSTINIDSLLIKKIENSFFVVDNAKQKKINKLNEVLNNKEKELNNIQQQINVLQETVCAIEKEKETYLKKLETVLKERGNQEKELFDIIKNLENNIKVYINKIDVFDEQLIEKDNNIQQLVHENDKIEKELTIRDTRLKELNDQIQEQNLKLVKINEENTFLHEAIEKEQNKKTMFENSVNNLEDKIREYRNQIYNINATSTEKDKYIKNLYAQLEEQKTEINKINKENTIFKGQLAREKEKNATLNNEFITINEQAYQYKMEYNRLINSKSINFIMNIKKYFGKEYNPKYITNDLKEIDFNETKEKKSERTYNIDKININYLDNISDEIYNMPQTNGCRFYIKENIKIGIICDRFLYDAYKDAAEFIYITPDNWKQKSSECKLLIVVTTWHGLNEEWQNLYSITSKNSKILLEIIEDFNLNGKKTIFYSKEDPASLKEFIHLARKCQYIFTNDIECIGDYKKECGNENVYDITFCINPLYHNPIGIKNHQNGVIFSGSWMERFPERCADQEELFDGIIKSGNELVIVDRNFNTHIPRYVFPERFHNYVVPNIEHDDLQKVHKLYNWAVNLNSYKTSSTVFANRTYELQASGNLIISNYSIGMFNLLPYIFIPISAEEVKKIIMSFTVDEIDERKAFGIRYTMSGETCFDRLSYLLSKVGIKVSKQVRKVCVVANVLTPSIIEMFNAQTYKEKTLVSNDDFTTEVYESHDIIAFFNDDMQYDMFYLEDMINAFKYTACDYITKDRYYSGEKVENGLEHTYVSIMKNKYRSVFWREAYEYNQLMQFQNKEKLPNGYSIDRFNYNEKKKDYITKLIHNNYKLSVIIPTYNNGDFLYGKALASLKRSKFFNEIEILIIDDGSTDGYTDQLVKYLEGKYSNIKTYFFNDGGSGSASRPRNKGVKLASTKFVAFIDPDNEIISDSYDEMCELMDNYDGLDFLCGNMMIVGKTKNKWNFYSYIARECDYCEIVKKDRLAILQGSPEILTCANFMGIQMQAGLFRKEFLLENKIEEVVGAYGEDTLFSWECIMAAKNFGIINEEISIYYSGRIDSAVNTVNLNFFERYATVEKPRYKFLVEKKLLSAYMDTKFNGYFKATYLQNLIYAQDNIKIDSIKCVEKVFDIYKTVYNGKDPIINDFIKICKQSKYDSVITYLKEAL